MKKLIVLVFCIMSMYLVSCKTTDRTDSALQASDGIRPATFTGSFSAHCTGGVDNKCSFGYNVTDDQEVRDYIVCVGTRSKCIEMTKDVMSFLKDKTFYHQPLIPSDYVTQAKYYSQPNKKSFYLVKDFIPSATNALCYYVTALRFSSKNPTAVIVGKPMPDLDKKCTDLEAEDVIPN